MTKITAMEEKRKKLKISPSHFYAAPRKPCSNSMLPIFDKSHTRNAMARFNQADFKNKAEKTRAYYAILRNARKYKISIDEFLKRRP